MAGQITSNLINRLSSSIALTTVEIFKMSNFPAPVSGVITLVNNTFYIIKAPLVTSDRFVIPAGGNVELASENIIGNNLVYTGTNTLFSSSTAINQLQINGLAMVATTPGATLFSLIGGATAGSAFVYAGSSVFGFTTLGSLTNFLFIVLSRLAFISFTNGLTLVDCFLTDIDRTSFTGTGAGTDAHVRFLGNTTQIIAIENANLTPLGAESSWFFDPDISPIAAVKIFGSTSFGTGEFFDTGLLDGTFSAVADAAVPTETITSVSNIGGIARFNFVAPPTLFVNQEVTIIGFSAPNLNYNTTARITVVGSGFFEIGLPFTGSEASVGSFTSDSVTLTIGVHTLTDGAKLLIENTINYDGGTAIYNVIADTSFQINRAFVITESGLWSADSLNETDKRMDVQNNGAQKDSKNIGSLVVNINTVATVIATQSVFTDLNLNAIAVPGQNIELWTLVNTTTGELRYDGVRPFSGLLVASFSATGAGGVSEYHFRAVVNGQPAIPAPEIGLDIGNTSQASATLICPITLVAGDLVRIQVSNIDNISNITIQFLTINIEQ